MGPGSRPGRRSFRFEFQTADVLPHSRGTMCPSFAWLSLETGGSREYRMRAAPAVSCAKLCERKRTRAYRFSGGTPAFPAQWLYGLLRALPGESGFVVSVVCKQLAHPRPVGPTCLFADLTPTAEASGPHDFTVRFGTARPHVPRIAHEPQKARPAIPSRARRRRVHRFPSQRS